MLALLVAIRDLLVALALAWVGVSMEARSSGDACAHESCKVQQVRR